MDNETIQQIFDEHEITLSHTEDIMVYGDGREEHTGRFHWALTHKQGGWTMPYSKPEDEGKARRHAAMFCYLWAKNVGLPLSDELAYLWANSK